MDIDAFLSSFADSLSPQDRRMIGSDDPELPMDPSALSGPASPLSSPLSDENSLHLGDADLLKTSTADMAATTSGINPGGDIWKQAMADASANNLKSTPQSDKDELPKLVQATVPAVGPMNLQVKHGGLSAPLRGYARGGGLSLKMGFSSAKPRKAIFADGGALPSPGGQTGGIGSLVQALSAARNSQGQSAPMTQTAMPVGMQSGPGDGRSDSIVTRMADGGEIATGDGEYVLPARTVSYWGGGSSNAGGGAFDHLVKHTDKLIAHEARNAAPPRGGR